MLAHSRPLWFDSAWLWLCVVSLHPTSYIPKPRHANHLQTSQNAHNSVEERDVEEGEAAEQHARKLEQVRLETLKFIEGVLRERGPCKTGSSSSGGYNVGLLAGGVAMCLHDGAVEV
jgi:hypothetical protein